tara:strand:+ start:1691 stop:4135 length:2445 start_codon:yes stop_codon:yes gene_type:complete
MRKIISIRLLILLIGCLSSSFIFAQTRKISGTITDTDGHPLFGASIYIASLSKGAATDFDGKFTIEDVADGSYEVNVTYVGYVAKNFTITVPLSSPLKITLEENHTTLEEFTVTAQKREENAQETPISMGVISGAKLAEKGDNSVDVALKNVTGVEVQGLAQGAQVYVRGVGSSIDPTFADPSIAMLVDNVYTGRTESVTSGMYDVKRMEVLRGPQGTLYGRNASGGLINIITNDPEINKMSTTIRQSVGNYNLFRTEGAVNFSTDSSYAVRIAAFQERRDGYIDDGSMNSDKVGFRAKVLYNPTKKISVLAKADIYREKGTGANTVPIDGSAGNLDFPPPYFFYADDDGNMVSRFPNGWVKSGDQDDPWSNNPEHVPGEINREAETFSLKVNADLGFADLTILPSYSRSKNYLLSSFLFGSIDTEEGATYTTENYTSQNYETYYYSTEARLASKSAGPLKYVAGLYYFGNQNPNGIVGELQTTDGNPLNTVNTYLPGQTLAGFGQLTYSITENLHATGGLRYSSDYSGQTYEIIVDGESSGEYTFEQTQESTQFKVGLEYNVTRQNMLYGHVASGFKQGGISPTIPSISFDPETLIAYEIGSKNRFFNSHLQLNVSAFYYDYDNYQYSFLQTLNVGDRDETSQFSVIHNAGKTSIKGAEMDLELIPWNRGNLIASFTYLDAKYGEATLPNNPFVNQGEFDLEGKQIQNAPEWVTTIGFEQGFKVGPYILTGGINSKISAGYYVTPEQYLPGAYQDSYTRTNASLRYGPASHKWSVGLWVKNIENEAQTTYVYPAYRRLINAPRTYGLNVEFTL